MKQVDNACAPPVGGVWNDLAEFIALQALRVPRVRTSLLEPYEKISVQMDGMPEKALAERVYEIKTLKKRSDMKWWPRREPTIKENTPPVPFAANALETWKALQIMSAMEGSQLHYEFIIDGTPALGTYFSICSPVVLKIKSGCIPFVCSDAPVVVRPDGLEFILQEQADGSFIECVIPLSQNTAIVCSLDGQACFLKVGDKAVAEINRLVTLNAEKHVYSPISDIAWPAR